jgi:hypothetical protein
MAATFTPFGNTSASLGQALGTGIAKPIEQGLDFLTNQKMQQITQKHQHAPYIGLGYTPKEAAFIHALPEKYRWEALQALAPQGGRMQQQQQNPMEALQQEQPMQQQQNPNQQVMDLLQSLGKGRPISELGGLGQLAAPQQQLPQMQQPQQQQMAQQPESQGELSPRERIAEYRKNAAQQQQEAKPLSAAQKKYNDSIVDASKNAEDILETAQRMLEYIGEDPSKSKLQYGAIATLKSKINPTWLGEEGPGYDSEDFDKDATHLINLESAKLKGVPSKFRVQLIQKEKAGVEHTPKVNKRILQRYEKLASEKLRMLHADHPDIFKNDQSSSGGNNTQVTAEDAENNPLEHPDFFQEGTRYEEDGVTYVLKNGDWSKE